jgi:hypothetical protein
MSRTERIEELLTSAVLLRDERTELYRLARWQGVDVRQRRMQQLMGQKGLLADDSAELRRLGDELGVAVNLVRIDFMDY